jgi:hypothetical protein
LKSFDPRCQFVLFIDIGASFRLAAKLHKKGLIECKGRKLSFEGIKHCQKIIKILSEIDGILKTIEMPL